MMMFKNIFSFALTFHGYDWLQQSGAKHVFIAIGSVQVALSVLGLAMCKFLIPSSSISHMHRDIPGASRDR